MDLQTLIDELIEKIIDTLELEDVTKDDFNEDEQLVGGDLGIDSIDVLELVMMIEQDYNVKIDNKEVGEKVFKSIKTLAHHILDQQ
jgi:acyl carrier protein